VRWVEKKKIKNKRMRKKKGGKKIKRDKRTTTSLTVAQIVFPDLLSQEENLGPVSAISRRVTAIILTDGWGGLNGAWHADKESGLPIL